MEHPSDQVDQVKDQVGQGQGQELDFVLSTPSVTIFTFFNFLIMDSPCKNNRRNMDLTQCLISTWLSYLCFLTLSLILLTEVATNGIFEDCFLFWNKYGGGCDGTLFQIELYKENVDIILFEKIITKVHWYIIYSNHNHV